MGAQVKGSPLHGGNLALDFANTVDYHASDHPKDLLGDYSRLVAWSVSAEAVDPAQAQGLLSLAAAQPEAAAGVYRRAVEVREALYRVFTAVARGKGPPQADLELVNGEVRAAYANARLVAAPDGFRLEFSHATPPGATAGSGGVSLDMLLWPILHAAAELLTRGDLERVKQCAGESGCGWLFYDTTKNRSRRWCNMAICGNRNKARKHYEKLRRKAALLQTHAAGRPPAANSPARRQRS